jgi:hypothetical protein
MYTLVHSNSESFLLKRNSHAWKQEWPDVRLHDARLAIYRRRIVKND